MSEPWRLEWHASLPSTMDRATQLAATGEPAGTVVVADYQSQGRGTRGRTWTSPPNTCLTFSVILRPEVTPDRLAQLPAHIADLVAAFLRRQFGLDALVKAPNDVLVNGKKICGILCTSRVQAEMVEWVICGIGLNTTMSQAELPTSVATSLALEGVDVTSHQDLLDELLVDLEPLLAPDLPRLAATPSGCAVQS